LVTTFGVPARRGRDVVYDYLHDVGVRYVFGVPGTNEVPLIDGTSVLRLGRERIEYVPCLHENIAVGAAMGYARGSGLPGVVELHVTPGIAHGIGNLYNAYKSHVPIVVLCAQQHSELLLLESDLVQIARQFTKWAHEVRIPSELPLVMQRAFKEAMTPPTQPVFVAIPWDFTIATVDVPEPDPTRPLVTRVCSASTGDEQALTELGRRLLQAKTPMIVAGDGVGAAGAWEELGALAAQLGAPVYSASHSSRMNFPSRSLRWQGELPQTQKDMRATFGAHEVVFLCGYNSQAPVLVFQHEHGSLIPADVQQLYLHDDPWEIGKNGVGEVAVLGDIKKSLPLISAAVDRLATEADRARLKATDHALTDQGAARAAAQTAYRTAICSRGADAPLMGENVADALDRLLPKPFTIVNEAVSDAAAIRQYLDYSAPQDYFFGAGGSLGFSMPASIGFKLALRDTRTVVNVVGDGSALFYPHTWWTTFKRDLAILTIVVNNHQYRTLVRGVAAVGAVCDWHPTDDKLAYLHLESPATSFVQLASAFGIAAERVDRLGDSTQRSRAGSRRSPRATRSCSRS
jgi:benzoylformate decarboxylase